MATEVKRKRGPVDRKAASLATKLYRQQKIATNMSRNACRYGLGFIKKKEQIYFVSIMFSSYMESHKLNQEAVFTREWLQILHTNKYNIVHSFVSVTQQQLDYYTSRSMSAGKIFNNSISMTKNDGKRKNITVLSSKVSFDEAASSNHVALEHLIQMNLLCKRVFPKLYVGEKTPTILKSKVGCSQQVWHTDYSSKDIKSLKNSHVPLSLWIPVSAEGGSICVCDMGERKMLNLRQGDLLVFRSDLIHAGAPCEMQENYRLHCYLDSPDIERPTGYVYPSECPNVKERSMDIESKSRKMIPSDGYKRKNDKPSHHNMQTKKIKK